MFASLGKWLSGNATSSNPTGFPRDNNFHAIIEGRISGDNLKNDARESIIFNKHNVNVTKEPQETITIKSALKGSNATFTHPPSSSSKETHTVQQVTRASDSTNPEGLSSPDSAATTTESTYSPTLATSFIETKKDPISKSNIALIPAQSTKIHEWANKKSSDLTALLSDLTAYVDQNTSSTTSQKNLAELKQLINTLKSYTAQASTYALITEARTNLLDHHENAEEDPLTSAQLVAEWNTTKQEPWATNSVVNKITQQITSIIKKITSDSLVQKTNEQTSSLVTDVDAHQLPEPHQRTYASAAHESNEDIVSVPGVGNVDRNQYDIGYVEHHEDGTSTITDMTGRRYDYPPRRPSSDSCTVS